MMNRRSNRHASFSSRRTQALALAGVLTLAAAGGAQKSIDRFAPDGSGTPDLLETALEFEEAALAGAPASVPETVEAGSGLEAGWDLPNLDHERVDDFVRIFTTSKRADFGRFLERSGRYEEMIAQKLAERGMPQDLIYLAMIESGFNSKAYSHAHASGLWQFIAETGKRYGLDINVAVDERRDPVKATDAALSYLQTLHDRFGSWYLAAAAYNTGENRVGRIMREETGSERGSEESYYTIRHRLPRETRDYVPLMVAAARISKDLPRYGFDTIEKEAPLAYDEVTVPAASSLAVVARAAGTSVAQLRELNPHFKLDRTRNDRASAVRIPAGTGQAFAANWAATPAPQRLATASRAAPPPRPLRPRRSTGTASAPARTSRSSPAATAYRSARSAAPTACAATGFVRARRSASRPPGRPLPALRPACSATRSDAART
jgi:membrane-bound lytic murein transglycosylase D